MKSILSPASHAAIVDGLSTALAASRTPGVIINRPAPAAPPRRAAKPVQVDLNDVTRCVRMAIAQVSALDKRAQRPMVTGSAFEPLYRYYELRSDRLSTLLACFSGSLSLYAPEAAELLIEFLKNDHLIASPVAGDILSGAEERSPTP
jgi:hypothetical protein